MIRLNKITSTIRIFGQCSYRRRIRGTVTITYGGVTRCVTAYEGHVNSAVPRRVLFISDLTEDWIMSEELGKLEERTINFTFEPDEFVFSVERISVAVEAESPEESTNVPFRGYATLTDAPSADVVDVYENVYGNDSKPTRRFRLVAPLDVLLKIKSSIAERNECVLRETS